MTIGLPLSRGVRSLGLRSMCLGSMWLGPWPGSRGTWKYSGVWYPTNSSWMPKQSGHYAQSMKGWLWGRNMLPMLHKGSAFAHPRKFALPAEVSTVRHPYYSPTCRYTGATSTFSFTRIVAGNLPSVGAAAVNLPITFATFGDSVYLPNGSGRSGSGPSPTMRWHNPHPEGMLHMPATAVTGSLYSAVLATSTVFSSF